MKIEKIQSLSWDLIGNIQGISDILLKDKTGELCYRHAVRISNGLEDISKRLEDVEGYIRRLEDGVRVKDKTGEWCYKFARDVNGANIELLEQIIKLKDKSGKWVDLFRTNILGEVDLDSGVADDTEYDDSVNFNRGVASMSGMPSKKEIFEIVLNDRTGGASYDLAVTLQDSLPANILNFLEDAIISKDRHGEWCYKFAVYVKGADIPLLQQAVIDRDSTGKWCYWFAVYVKGADIPLLQQTVIDKDPTGRWCYRFAEDVKGADNWLYD